MNKLVVKINGEIIENVTNVKCSNDYSKVRIVRYVDNRYINQDYDAETVEVNIVGGLVDYRLPIKCTVVSSKSEFIGVEGRYKAVIEDRDLGIVRITEDNDWINLKVAIHDIEDVDGLINKGGGTLDVEVSNSGLGKIHRKENKLCQKG